VYGTQIKPGSSVSLERHKTRTNDSVSKEEGLAELRTLAAELCDLQKLLFAAGTHALLVVLQGMETSGKDGTIREAFREVNPAGVTVTPFKVPTPAELAHDFLWRVHPFAPARGQIAIFNRSHYEDVVVVRVHDLVPKEIWSARYDQINEFERLLTDNQTIVAKFFLHVSKDEQEDRLLDREADLTDAWKLSVTDWAEREHWDSYQKAYSDALERCSTRHAPWTVIPSDQKWFRNLAVTEALVKQLRPYSKAWSAQLESEAAARLAELERARSEGSIPRPTKPDSSAKSSEG
jgi:PPK2 family polyphosphate:nucleotide phosphotransferase